MKHAQPIIVVAFILTLSSHNNRVSIIIIKYNRCIGRGASGLTKSVSYLLKLNKRNLFRYIISRYCCVNVSITNKLCDW